MAETETRETGALRRLLAIWISVSAVLGLGYSYAKSNDSEYVHIDSEAAPTPSKDTVKDHVGEIGKCVRLSRETFTIAWCGNGTNGRIYDVIPHGAKCPSGVLTFPEESFTYCIEKQDY